MGRPRRIDRSVKQQKGGSLFIRTGVEGLYAARTARATPRERRLYIRCGRSVYARRQVQSMNALVIRAAARLGHGHYKYRAVRPGVEVDHRSRGDAYDRHDLIAS